MSFNIWPTTQTQETQKMSIVTIVHPHLGTRQADQTWIGTFDLDTGDSQYTVPTGEILRLFTDGDGHGVFLEEESLTGCIVNCGNGNYFVLWDHHARGDRNSSSFVAEMLCLHRYRILPLTPKPLEALDRVPLSSPGS
jgi:hypothetical protein